MSIYNLVDGRQIVVTEIWSWIDVRNACRKSVQIQQGVNLTMQRRTVCCITFDLASEVYELMVAGQLSKKEANLGFEDLRVRTHTMETEETHFERFRRMKSVASVNEYFRIVSKMVHEFQHLSTIDFKDRPVRTIRYLTSATNLEGLHRASYSRQAHHMDPTPRLQ